MRAKNRPIRRTGIGFGTMLYIAVTVFMGIGAINSQNNLLFFSFGLAIAGVVLSGVLSGFAMMGLRVERQAEGMSGRGGVASSSSLSASLASSLASNGSGSQSDMATVPGRVGASMPIRYTVVNRNRFLPVFGLQIEEIFNREETRSGRAPSLRAAVMHLPARATMAVAAAAVPGHRGMYRSRGIRISSAFPFGLLRKEIDFPVLSTFAIAPAHLPVRGNLLSPGRQRGSEMSRQTASRGSGDELYGLRAYHPGDPMRMVSWKVTARTDDLVVRQHTQTMPPRLAVMLDAPGPQTPRHMAERGIALAVSLVETGVSRGMAVSLVAPWAEVDTHPIANAAGLGPMLSAFAHVTLDREENLNRKENLDREGSTAGSFATRSTRKRKTTETTEAEDLGHTDITEQAKAGRTQTDPERKNTVPGVRIVYPGSRFETEPGSHASAIQGATLTLDASEPLTWLTREALADPDWAMPRALTEATSEHAYVTRLRDLLGIGPGSAIKTPARASGSQEILGREVTGQEITGQEVKGAEKRRALHHG